MELGLVGPSQPSLLVVCSCKHEAVLEVVDDEERVAAASKAVETAVADAFRHFFRDATIKGLVEVHAVTSWDQAKWQLFLMLKADGVPLSSPRTCTVLSLASKALYCTHFEKSKNQVD